MSANAEPTGEDEPHADEITRAAAARALGASPRLRAAANVGWSAFIGASLALVILLLMPEGWLDAPVTFGRLTLLFFSLWVIAVVPALSAALLAAGGGGGADAR